jgi:hypothetical protein
MFFLLWAWEFLVATLSIEPVAVLVRTCWFCEFLRKTLPKMFQEKAGLMLNGLPRSPAAISRELRPLTDERHS